MENRLIIGNQIVVLEKIDSTNTYLQNLISNNENEIEGIVILAKNQTQGKGQRGNGWESDSGKNLTFSLLLKPSILVGDQFVLSKMIALSIVDTLNEIGIKDTKIKWPNDIYCGQKKIAGILIENTVRDGKINNSIVGIGLNVNQMNFNSTTLNATSIKLEIDVKEIVLDTVLNRLLDFIDKRYLLFKTQNDSLLFDNEYLEKLYGINQLNKFIINNNETLATIIGIDSSGRLLINQENQINSFDLKEIKYLF